MSFFAPQHCEVRRIFSKMQAVRDFVKQVVSNGVIDTLPNSIKFSSTSLSSSTIAAPPAREMNSDLESDSDVACLDDLHCFEESE